MEKRKFRKLIFESPTVSQGLEPELKTDDFIFDKKLGFGAFGTVWQVTHKITSNKHCIKQVPKEKVLKMIDQFTREVYIMYELDHPHIIKLINHFEDAESFYLIMELAEGGNLFQKIVKDKFLLERTAAQYMRELVLAIEYLHSHQPAIIHRDIKPENVLLDSQGRVKLTDFGWSNYYSPEDVVPRVTLCGTTEYLPPEMLRRINHDTGVDIWCLGVLLYEMLTGASPFKSKDRKVMFQNIIKETPKFPKTFPYGAKDLILKMLQKDQNDRIPIHAIKYHHWLIEQPPLRETITQDLQEIRLPDFNKDSKIIKGYQVISPQQDRSTGFSSGIEDNFQDVNRFSTKDFQQKIIEEVQIKLQLSYRIEEVSLLLKERKDKLLQLEIDEKNKAEYNMQLKFEQIRLLSQLKSVQQRVDIINQVDKERLYSACNEMRIKMIKMNRFFAILQKRVQNCKNFYQSAIDRCEILINGKLKLKRKIEILKKEFMEQQYLLGQNSKQLTYQLAQRHQQLLQEKRQGTNNDIKALKEFFNKRVAKFMMQNNFASELNQKIYIVEDRICHLNEQIIYIQNQNNLKIQTNYPSNERIKVEQNEKNDKKQQLTLRLSKIEEKNKWYEDAIEYFKPMKLKYNVIYTQEIQQYYSDLNLKVQALINLRQKNKEMINQNKDYIEDLQLNLANAKNEFYMPFLSN